MGLRSSCTDFAVVDSVARRVFFAEAYRATSGVHVRDDASMALGGLNTLRF
jgi:hypothetical protein